MQKTPNPPLFWGTNIGVRAYRKAIYLERKSKYMALFVSKPTSENGYLLVLERMNRSRNTSSTIDKDVARELVHWHDWRIS